MYIDTKKKRIIAITLIVLVLLLVPFDSSSVDVYGCEITAYKAALYTVVRIEAFGFTRTKLYFFPSNFDANNNLKVSSEIVGSFSDAFKDIL